LRNKGIGPFLNRSCLLAISGNQLQLKADYCGQNILEMLVAAFLATILYLHTYLHTYIHTYIEIQFDIRFGTYIWLLENFRSASFETAAEHALAV
jgi:hypothetical protein